MYIFFSRWRLSCRRSVHNVADDFRKHYRDRVTGSSVSGHGLPETAQHPTDDAAPVACTVPQQGVDKYLSVRLAGNYGTLYGIQLRRAVSGADCSAGRESHYVGSDACGTVRYSRKRFVFPIFRSEVRFAPVYGLFGHGGLFSVIVSAFRFYESGTCLVFLLGIVYTLFNLSPQVKIMAVLPQASTISMTIYSAVFNLGIGCGTTIGGAVCIHASIAYIGYAGESLL